MGFANIPIQDIPAMKPPGPPGAVIPNFNHPYSSAYLTLTIIALALPLMLIFVTLRVYVRLWVKKTWAYEDSKSPSLSPSSFRLTRETSRLHFRRPFNHHPV